MRRERVLKYPCKYWDGNKYFTIETPGKVSAEEQGSIYHATLTWEAHLEREFLNILANIGTVNKYFTIETTGKSLL